MAKTDAASLLEQHIEKGMLVICVLGMLYGIFHWVVWKPERTEVPRVAGGTVSPKKLDAKLLEEANRLANRPPEDPPFKKLFDYPGHIARHRRTPIGPAEMTDWGDHRTVVVPPATIKPPEGVHLAKIQEILEARAPVLKEVNGDLDLINKGDGIDKLAFRGKAEFPMAQLLKAWNKKFRGSAMDEVPAVVLRVEIERQAVLSDGSFGPTVLVERVVMPDAEGKLPKDVDIPKYTGDNAEAVLKAVKEFSGATQQRILRPPYWWVWSPSAQDWTRPWRDDDTSAKESEAEPGEKSAPDPAAPAAPAAPVAPAAAADVGVLKLWFHDTKVTVQQRYRYRVRLVFVNPMLTRDDVVYKGTPQDAAVPSINSKWSQWLGAEAIPRTTRFFVVSALVAGAKKDLKCAVFTRSLGQRVMHKFTVVPGRVIGGVKTKDVRNPATGQIVKTEVDFSTGAIVVHIDFSKKIINRLGRTEETQELICLENGKLVPHIRVLDLPREDPRYLAYKKELDAVAKGQTGGDKGQTGGAKGE